jgi:copper chaperone CopZ
MGESTTTYAVTGMTCEHCVSAVTGELSKLPGVTGVTVDLVPGGASKVAVRATSPLDGRAVAEAVDEAGYELAGDS